MSSIVVSGDTSGAVTLSAPAVAGTVTVTLPSTSGVMAVGGGTITTLTTTSDITVNGLTVGRGGAGGAANTAYGASAIPIAPNSGVVAIGSNAGKLFNTASDTGQSTFVGYFAGASCVSGTDNTFIGGSAGTNTTGSKNTAVGSQALQSNTTASNNTAVGYQAGYAGVTAANNTFVGYQAGYYLTKNRNTTIGVGAGAATSGATAEANTIIGHSAGNGLTSGSNNTFVGGRSDSGTNEGAGFALTTGSYNNFFGGSAGAAITTGSKNTVLGNYNGNTGGLDIRTASNYIVLSDGDGNMRLYLGSGGSLVVPQVYVDTTANAANVNVRSDGLIWRSTSALKYKQDIRDVEDFDISALRPVRYKSKCENDDQTKDHLGLIADEAASAGFEELVTRGEDGAVEGFQYERLTVVLLKAMQTLKAEVDTAKAQIAALQGASA